FEHLTARPIEVIVIDNASTAGNVSMVTSLFPEVRLICSGTNRGFGSACNQGLLIARAPYALLLNSDTELIDDSLWILVDWLEGNPRCGACGPANWPDAK